MNASTPESEVGTVCVSSASTGLYGGRPVMVVPTVTRVHNRVNALRVREHSTLRTCATSSAQETENQKGETRAATVRAGN